MIMNIKEIRREFLRLYKEEKFVMVSGNVKTLEIAPAYFIADEDRIFREPNDDYIKRELKWYESMSLNVNDIPGGAPEIWKKVATPDGRINSNYGWAILDKDNGLQYYNVFKELSRDPYSRRALMIYTRPSMHTDQHCDGMQDFMCTNSVQYLYRDGQLDAIVNMRSNDAIFGYLNDYAWQKHVLEKLAQDLNVSSGDIYWSAGSLHIYERHFYLLEDER